MRNSVDKDYLIRPCDVRRSFNASAGRYDEYSFLQRTITDRLFESFDYIRIDPENILDLGSGTGYGAKKLKGKFKKAHIFQLDIAENMLSCANRNKRRFFSKEHFLCADAARMPLKKNSFDLVFSGLMLQWCQEPDRVFSEIRRVMKPHGIFLFSSLGPDTLHELRESWRKVDGNVHVNSFVDMHDIGDALIRNGLSAPVLDTDHIILIFPDCRQLMRELKNIGAKNINSGRSRSLTGKNRMQQVFRHYDSYRREDGFPATYEVIYGHAWAGESEVGIPNKDPGRKIISLQYLKQKLR